jgi:hypothetical protein
MKTVRTISQAAPRTHNKISYALQNKVISEIMVKVGNIFDEVAAQAGDELNENNR